MDAVKRLVAEHAPHFKILKGDPPKVECVLNGHTFPANEEQIRCVLPGGDGSSKNVSRHAVPVNIDASSHSSTGHIFFHLNTLCYGH